MLRREMEPKMPWPDDSWAPSFMMEDYVPTDEDIALIKSRIRERIHKKVDWYRYFKLSITLSWVRTFYGEQNDE